MDVLRPEIDPDLEMFRDSVRKFFEREIAPHREKWLKQGHVDREAFKWAGEQGFLCMWADEKYGGMGLTDFRFEQILIEEQARIDESGLFMTLHSRLVGPYIQHFGTEDQRERYLPGCISGDTILGIAMTEPDAGSDLRGMRSTATRTDGGWVLKGAKTYISNGLIGDLFVVAAKTDPENPRNIGLFLVESGFEGFRRGNKLEKMGYDSQDTAELFFDDVFVPDANVLGDPAKGMNHLMLGLVEERLICATQAVATAQRAFDLTKEFVSDRKLFGQMLSDYQNTRFKMAQMRAEIDMAQVFIDRLVELHNAEKLAVPDAAKGKLLATEMLARVVDEGVQLHGGAGYMREFPICRLYEDARVMRIYAGTSEIMRELIARSVFDSK